LTNPDSRTDDDTTRHRRQHPRQRWRSRPSVPVIAACEPPDLHLRARHRCGYSPLSNVSGVRTTPGGDVPPVRRTRHRLRRPSCQTPTRR